MSGLSSDMRTLLASGLPAAKEAVDLFVYRVGRELGSLTAALHGLDAVVFTGGSARMRWKFGLGSAVTLNGWASRSTIGPAPPEDRAFGWQFACVGVGHPDGRGSCDRPPHARIT